MPTIKELKQICKDKKVELCPHWTKEQIIMEIYLKTGITIEKTEEEKKKEEKKAENQFIKELVHDVKYFTRDEFIELNGIEFVEDVEKKYGNLLHYNN